jgi:hypothetical protein
MTFLDSRLFVTHTSAAASTSSGSRLHACWRYSGIGTHKTHRSAEEQTLFWPGPGPRAIDLDGWRIGLGICRDTGVDEKVYGTARLGVDLCACGIVRHAWELAEQRIEHATSLRPAVRRWLWRDSGRRPSCEPVREGPPHRSA